MSELSVSPDGRDVPPELQDAALQLQRAQQALAMYMRQVQSKYNVLLRETIPNLRERSLALDGNLESLQHWVEVIGRVSEDILSGFTFTESQQFIEVVESIGRIEDETLRQRLHELLHKLYNGQNLIYVLAGAVHQSQEELRKTAELVRAIQQLATHAEATRRELL